MKTLGIILILVLTSCASTERTKYSDPIMRVLVDPISVGPTEHALIQTALVESGLYEVVDRSKAFRAIKKEQEREHRHLHDRFSNVEKYSRWQKLWGAAAIVVPHSSCRAVQNHWTKQVKTVCQQFLSLVDSSTSKVILAIRTQASGSQYSYPDWDEAVELFNDAFPKDFDTTPYTEKLKKWREKTRKLAVEQEKENYYDLYSDDGKNRNNRSEPTLVVPKDR